MMAKMNVIIVNYNSGNLCNSFLKVVKKKINIIISEDPQKIRTQKNNLAWCRRFFKL